MPLPGQHPVDIIGPGHGAGEQATQNRRLNTIEQNIGEAWKGIGPAATDAVPLQNGWTIYQASAFYKDPNGIVRLRGELLAGTWTVGTTLFTLPVGYRPFQRMFVPVYMNAGIGVLVIQTSGAVQIELRAGASTHIHGLSPMEFRAEA